MAGEEAVVAYLKHQTILTVLRPRLEICTCRTQANSLITWKAF